MLQCGAFMAVDEDWSLFRWTHHRLSHRSPGLKILSPPPRSGPPWPCAAGALRANGGCHAWPLRRHHVEADLRTYLVPFNVEAGLLAVDKLKN